MTNKLVDTHFHLWDLANNINEWVLSEQTPEYLRRDYLISDYFLDFQDKPQSLISIEASSGDKTLEEVYWLNKALKHLPNTINYYHIAYINLLEENEENFLLKLNQFKEYKFVIGFRHILAYSESSAYCPTNFDFTLSNHLKNIFYRNICTLNKHGYLVNLQMYFEQLLNCYHEIKTSGITSLIDHLGLPNYSCINKVAQWIKFLKMYSNISYLKLSGIDIDKENKDILSVLRNVKLYYDVDKLIYGSNYPVSKIETINYFKEQIETVFSTGETDKIFADNAIRLLFKKG